jgi:dTMP kinase
MSALAAIASTSSVLFIRNPYYLSRSKKLPQKPNDSIEKRGLDYLLDIQARLKETILKLNIKHIFIDASLNIDEIAKKIEDFINAK